MVDTLLPSLICLTLMGAVAGKAMAQDSALPAIEPAATTPGRELQEPEESVAQPTTGERHEIFVLKLTALREKTVTSPDAFQTNPFYDNSPSFESPTLRGSSKVPADGNSPPRFPSASSRITTPAPAIGTSPVATAEIRVVQVKEEIHLFCEDLQVTATVAQEGRVSYSLTCKGAVRIKTPTSEIIGQNATYADGTFKLESAEVTTSELKLSTSELTFRFPLSALDIQKAADVQNSPEMIPVSDFNPANVERNPSPEGRFQLH